MDHADDRVARTFGNLRGGDDVGFFQRGQNLFELLRVAAAPAFDAATRRRVRRPRKRRRKVQINIGHMDRAALERKR